MKTLVVYFSRTNVTKEVAQYMKKKIKADIDEVISESNYAGPIGYLRAGRESMAGKFPNINSKELKNPNDYDLVIIGTPIWGFTLASPIRTYINENKGRFKELAFFSTMGGKGAEKAFEEMTEFAAFKPRETLALLTKEVKEGTFKEKTDEFLKKLKV